MDVIEKRMGVPVTQMSSDQLLTYFEWGKKEVLGTKNPPGGAKQAGTFKSFQERYGQEEAGKIVKYAVFVKKCKFAGNILTASSFASGSKWITDGLQDEMQVMENSRPNPERDKQLRSGFTSLMDL